ncbi:MAG: 4Fe-4S binding protein [Nitrospirae bacterium]|nr:4Fe-4S binding protein [Nitrospirota bacterium]
MLSEKLIDSAFGSVDLPIAVDRSRCMRMRFDKNGCPVCISNCHAGAITIDDEIVIDADKCTHCMVCVSECPADCLGMKDSDFLNILARLRKLQNSISSPVIGCKKSAGSKAHEKISCLGALSEEHLIALYTVMDRPLQLDLSLCKTCNNAFVMDTLKERVAAIRETTGIDILEKTVFIESMAELRFEAVSLDRRSFFYAVKNMAFLGAAKLIDADDEDTLSYSKKKLPLKRMLLNTSLRKITDHDITSGILKEYAFTITTDASCDSCYSCVGICPTGALKNGVYEPRKGLYFNASLCSGCALCRDFCFSKSLLLQQGYTGNHYFEYEICNNELEDASLEEAVDLVCCSNRRD